MTASLTPAHQYQTFRLKSCELWLKGGGGSEKTWSVTKNGFPYTKAKQNGYI